MRFSEMPFPLSITGQVNSPATPFADNHTALTRMREALLAQTVDAVSVSGTVINFNPVTRGNERKPRPQGNGWMLFDLGPCWLSVQENETHVRVQYQLDTRFKFLLATSFSIIIGSIIQYLGGVQSEWGWVFAVGIWTVTFASSYLSKLIEFRRWIKSSLNCYDLPTPKRLRVPSEPSG